MSSAPAEYAGRRRGRVVLQGKGNGGVGPATSPAPGREDRDLSVFAPEPTEDTAETRRAGGGSVSVAAVAVGPTVTNLCEDRAAVGTLAAVDAELVVHEGCVEALLLQGAGGADAEGRAPVVLRTPAGVDDDHLTTSFGRALGEDTPQGYMV